MIIQRRFAPIGGRFEPEQVAGLAGIYMRQLRLCHKLHFYKGLYGEYE